MTATKTRIARATNLRTALARAIVVFLCLAGIGGCHQKPRDEAGTVTLYTSVDDQYVRPIVEQFQRDTGIKVTLLTDAEASKSVGLAERIRAEKDHPQADVWWDNECFLAIALANDGLLTPYDSPSAADIPARYKDPLHRWAGSIIRVRTLVSAAARKPKGDAVSITAPTRLADLLRPEFKGQIALARPTAGTTGGHVACLYVVWGTDRARTYFHGLRDNGVLLLGGNAVVAESVARGDILAGICDNDDAADASAEVGKLDAVLPDQCAGEDGTLAMPCAVGLVAGCPRPAAARRLIDYILSRDVDKKMAQTRFAWCSARDVAGKGHFMDVDYQAVSKAMPMAIRDATTILEGR